MSIDAAIVSLVNQGKLVLVSHTLPAIPVVRDVFASPAVMELIEGGHFNSAQMERMGGRARAKVDNIVAGRKFVFGLDPYEKSTTCTVSRNRPVSFGVVEVRVTDPDPAARIFGCVAKRNVLILLTWAEKKGLVYKQEVDHCRKEWNLAFPNHHPPRCKNT